METLNKQKIADILYSYIKQMMGLAYISQNDIPEIAGEITKEFCQSPDQTETPVEQLIESAEDWFDKNSMNYKGIKSRHYAIQMIKDFASRPAGKQVSDEELCIILHGGKPLNNRIFTSINSARNYVKMTYPRRRFSEPKDNVFLDKNYGAKFEIVELQNNN
jgi:hypothetical protein